MIPSNETITMWAGGVGPYHPMALHILILDRVVQLKKARREGFPFHYTICLDTDKKGV